MIKKDIKKIDIDSLKQRYAVDEVKNFIKNKDNISGKIVVLYGLRRTGKTTIMEQVISAYQKKGITTTYYEIESADTLHDINTKIIEEKNLGTSLICLDEITKAQDFITNSAPLSDVFAKEGIQIIVTGTDSLMFRFAEESELYDRIKKINTTHIPFEEHCFVLDTNDMDDYIEFGGLMKKGEKSERIVNDYISACKYLDSAVAENISRSIKKKPYDDCLDCLSLTELKTIVEKLVEKYSGKFDKKTLSKPLTSASVLFASNKAQENNILDEIQIQRLVQEKDDIVKDFLKEINADKKIEHTITDIMVDTLKSYLIDMHVLSGTLQKTYRYEQGLGWRTDPDTHEYYLVQPAIKFYHLQKGIEFIENEDYYRDLTNQQKQFLKKKLDEKIKGDMTEQIVLFDVGKELSLSEYDVCKPVFYKDGSRIGEYDMLIYSHHHNKYWGFEIKHTTNFFSGQDKHLVNPFIRNLIDSKYGKRENVCVLYRGESGVSPTGTIYLNISEFLKKIHLYKDMDRVFCDMCKNLPKLKVISQGNNISFCR